MAWINISRYNNNIFTYVAPMINEARLAEMLCTRLCHDLTGPIGAVNNGAEFLSDEGFEMQSEAMQLILSSAHEAVNRLQFYRQAYGRVGDNGETGLAEKKQLTEAFFSASKVKLDWPDSHTDASGVSISQKMGRLILNLILVAGSSLIRGGIIAVRLHEDSRGEKEILITATGETVKLDAETLTVLRGHGEEAMLTPKTSQPLLTMHIIEEIGADLTLEVESGKLTLRCRHHAMVHSVAAG
ncbi:MAG: histidine phosphotransferase family protein [Alphaproteobacteria bacterium]